MSSLAPSSVVAEAPENVSPVMGCRCGSMHTSLQTSVIRLAMVSRISLCLIVGNPPFGQDRECSTVKCEPQAHCMGGSVGGLPAISES